MTLEQLKTTFRIWKDDLDDFADKIWSAFSQGKIKIGGKANDKSR